MASHAVGNHTPDLQFFPFEKVPRWVARVLGFEHHLATVPSKTLAQRLAVHSGDHNVARLSLNGAVDYHEVAWVDGKATAAGRLIEVPDTRRPSDPG